MIGQKLGSFRIEAKLGSGAMGVVYRGINEATGRQAAIKVVTAELIQKGTAYERFKREAEILQQFRHPNIVRFLALGRFRGTSYFAMEFVAGVTLEKLLEERGFLAWQDVVLLGIQICDALHYAHQHGVVHRDLKPSNLLISEKMQVKLTDFGIAKDLDATALTGTGRTLGTATYMAPEQIRGTPEVSHKTDLYGLGVVLYQMLTGEVPFQGPTPVVLMHRHLTDSPPRPSTKLSEIPLELDDLVVRLMAKEPGDRPWDAQAVAMTLTELRDKQTRGEPIEMVWAGIAPDASARGTATRSRKRRKQRGKSGIGGLDESLVQTGLLVLALVALGAFAGYMLWPPSADYLFHQAEAMMASKDTTDWSIAEKDYLDELDRLHPNHAYRKQVRAWRDRNLLHRVERRAYVLSNTKLGSLVQPDNEAEKIYVKVRDDADDDSKQGRDFDASQRWRYMASLIEEKYSGDRGWLLFAQGRASELEKKMSDRREEVTRQLDRADVAERAGRIVDAIQMRVEVVKRYSSHLDIADLIARARSGLPPPPSPVAPDAEKPVAPSSPNAAAAKEDR